MSAQDTTLVRLPDPAAPGGRRDVRVAQIRCPECTLGVEQVWLAANGVAYVHRARQENDWWSAEEKDICGDPWSPGKPWPADVLAELAGEGQ